jgi:pSer/pThr/pTyr-binding forkhead associated (FHA) protein
VGGQSFDLRYDSSKVGRLSEPPAPEVDLSTLDTAGMVSRRHAVITREGATVHVEDLGSSNGTSVNQVRLVAALQHTLEDQDLVRFGNLEFRFQKSPTA